MSSSVVHTNLAVCAVCETSTGEQSTPAASSHARYSPKSTPAAPTSAALPPSTPMA